MARAYGLIGFPVAHSFSPKYFGEKFQREGIKATYTAFPLEQITQFPEWLAAHPQISGLNVTIPHKTSILPYLDELDIAAREIGAVNCIAIRHGRLIGYNTDAVGFEQSLVPLLQAHHHQALVLGSGGASKAVCYVLRRLGITVSLVSRAPSSPHILSYEAVSSATLTQHHLIINTTPLGMHPMVHGYPSLPYQHLTPEHLLYDLIYNPEETRFLQIGRARGAAVKNGLDMLHLQAEAAWDIWTGG